ncbi:hypothetical protein BJY59DRAFT_653086, partial [Rhodotorula toruloides]
MGCRIRCLPTTTRYVTPALERRVYVADEPGLSRPSRFARIARLRSVSLLRFSLFASQRRRFGWLRCNLAETDVFTLSQTTPLWRRSHDSTHILCNACALFFKMKGRPRPISLKTDVIKSRNR